MHDTCNNEVIDGPDYYRLPCGRYLEDFILYYKLDFFFGSGIKYLYRAGKKHGESESKDTNKAWHYATFIHKNNVIPEITPIPCSDRWESAESVMEYMHRLLDMTSRWNTDE